jgi:hypothetical protein
MERIGRTMIDGGAAVTGPAEGADRWDQLYQELTADDVSTLGPDQLEQLAQAAFWLGRPVKRSRLVALPTDSTATRTTTPAPHGPAGSCSTTTSSSTRQQRRVAG